MYVGIDIGGTNIRIAFSDSLENAKLQNKTEFVNSHNYEIDKKKIGKEIGKVGEKIEGIGIGIPGSISDDKKTVISGRHNYGWINTSIVDDFSSMFNCPVYIENDAVVAGMGVYYYGEGKNKNFAYVTWGTGIGGEMIKTKNKKVILTMLEWNKHFETWEDKCGGKAIEKKYGKTGDKLNEKEWKKVMKDFSFELNSFIDKTKTKLIIFGGGIAIKQKERVLKTKQKLSDKCSRVNIVVSSLGEDSGLYGAIGLIKYEKNKISQK